MAAGLGNTKNIFSSPYDNTRKLGAYYLKMSWAEGSFSDPMTILNAYQYWKTRFDSKTGVFQEGTQRRDRMG